jgi:hypothetical protein
MPGQFVTCKRAFACDGAKHVELNWAHCRLRPLGNAVHEAFAVRTTQLSPDGAGIA